MARIKTADAQDIRRRYLAGEGGDHIAYALGLSRDSIYRCLKAERVPLRPGGRTKLGLEPEAIAAVYAQGLTITELARQLGCARPSIAKRLAAAGVDLSFKAHKVRRRARLAAARASEAASNVLRVDRQLDGTYAVKRGGDISPLAVSRRQKDAVACARALQAQSSPCPRLIICRTARR